jgi:hypothetical protein
MNLVREKSKMSEENLVIRSKGALANSSNELPPDADVSATFSVYPFVPELMKKFIEESEETRVSNGTS